MSFARIARLATLSLLAAGFAVTGASAQLTGRRVFSTAESCELSTLLTAAQCRNAHANALGELDEKSPRFPSRVECEKNFKHCMIAGFQSRRVEFEPALRGFEVNARSDNDKTVLPVIEGDSSVLGFRARTALRADAGISGSSRAQAQARWTQVQKARAAAEAAAAAATSVPAGAPDWDGAEPAASAPDLAPTEPRPPSAYDRAAAERRRQEILNAPTVFNPPPAN